MTQALSGKYLIEAQAAGVSSRYEVSANSSPEEVATMLSRLLDLYDLAVASPTAQPPGAGLTGGVGVPDAAILAWMLGQLQIVRAHTVDFSQPFIR